MFGRVYRRTAVNYIERSVLIMQAVAAPVSVDDNIERSVLFEQTFDAIMLSEKDSLFLRALHDERYREPILNILYGSD